MENAKKEWNDIISKKLKEGVSLRDLGHTYPGEIFMEPNVTAFDIKNVQHKLDISRAWINMAEIKGGSSTDKNQMALLALQQGADGLSIVISPGEDIHIVMSNIMTEYLEVRLVHENIPKEECDKIEALFAKNANVRCLGNHFDAKEVSISKDNRIQSIQEVIEGLDSSYQYDITIDLSKNILFEIASLRAIRILMQEKGIRFRLLAGYTVDGNNELGDYNLIEKTYKVLSGVLGGADAILTSYNGDEESRLTLNIHHVLDLESGLKLVTDAVGGSYYIEKLTGEIVSKVNGINKIQ